MPLHVIEQPNQGADPAGTPNDARVQAHGHHARATFVAQSIQPVEGVAAVMEEIIAGTGGGELRGVRHPLAYNSVSEIHGRFGVLKLLLGSGEYSHAFIDTDGRVWDPARGKCH